MKNKIDKSIFKRSGSSSEGTQLAEENLSAGTTFSAVVLEKFETLLESIKAGHLDARADLSDTSGADREMLEGINEMLDAVIGPLNVAAEYVDRISKGDIPEPITDEYKGDFNEIKNNLNVLIDAMNKVIKVAQEIALGNPMVQVEKRSEQDKLMKALEQMVGAMDKITKLTQEIALGNLMVQVEKRSEQDKLMKALEQMVDNLRELVGQSQDAAEKVSATSQELSSSAQEMNATTEEVSSTVQQIATGSSKQAEATEKTSKIIEDISTTIKENASAAQAASAVAVEAGQKAQAGRNATQKTVEKMGQVNSVINEAVGFVRDLKDRSQQIGRIVDVITGFANQTNLLSLNAAIEAARAGESGRGFAVVAEEVRKLAEASKKSAEEIADLIAEIQAKTEKTVTSIDSGSKEVTEGMEVVKKTAVVFEEIVKGAEEAGAMSQQVASSSQQMVEGIEKIVKAVEEVSATAEENASAVQEVSASTEEQTASMEQMASSAQELSDMAIKLAELTAKFKVGGDKDVRR